MHKELLTTHEGVKYIAKKMKGENFKAAAFCGEQHSPLGMENPRPELHLVNISRNSAERSLGPSLRILG